MERWYVVRSRRGEEHRAARELRQQRFRVYLPKTFAQHHIGNQVVAIGRLRFVAYLFVAFDAIGTDGKHDSSVYAPIFNTRGVARLFCDARDVPVPVHDREIADIQRIEDLEHDIATTRGDRHRHQDEFEPGDLVEITSGRGAGFRGPVLSCIDGVLKLLAGGATVDADPKNCTVIQRVQKERGRNTKGHLPQFLTKART